MSGFWKRLRMAAEVVAGKRPADWDDYWYSAVTREASTGEVVSHDSAMRIVAVFACVRYISETLAQLPQIVYRRLPRGKDRARGYWLYELLNSRPNAWQTPSEFKSMLTGHVALRGNAYAEIVPGPSGFADQLVPLHPDRVEPSFVPIGRSGYMRYKVSLLGHTTESYILLQPEMLHLRGFGSNGFAGCSPIAMAREAVGIAMAAEKYTGRFYASDARPGVLHTDDELGPEVFERLKADWAAKHAGANRWRPVILEGGLKWQDIGMSHLDAQFIESKKFQISEIARLFGVKPHKIGDLERATFSNVEQQAQESITDTIGPYAVRWDDAVNRALVLDPDYFAEFLLEGLLRGDSKARSEFYRSGIMTGWLTRNEVRERENLNPLPGLDEPLVPLNMAEEGQVEGQIKTAKAMPQSIMKFLQASKASNVEDQDQEPDKETSNAS